MNKLKEMEKIAKEIENCEICKTESSGKAVVGEGSLDAEVIFIGEAPGKNEAIEGRPFIGRSGKLLRNLITSIGLLEKDVYITSPVKYLPDRGTPTSSQIAHGRTHLMRQFEIIKPKFVVLLGRVAAEGVLQKKVFVIREHGQIISSENGINYYLTLHPAAAIRFAKNMPLFKSDFQKLKSLI